MLGQATFESARRQMVLSCAQKYAFYLFNPNMLVYEGYSRHACQPSNHGGVWRNALDASIHCLSDVRNSIRVKKSGMLVRWFSIY